MVRLLTHLGVCVVTACVAMTGCGGGSVDGEEDDRRALPAMTATGTPTPPVQPADAAEPTPSSTPDPNPAAEPTATPAETPKPLAKRPAATPTPTATATPAATPAAPAPRRTLTRAQVIARGDRVCRQYGRDLERLAVPETPDARAGYYGDAARLAEKAVLRLERLRVPPGRRRTFDRYVELLWRNVDLLEELQAGLRDGDPEVEQRVGAQAATDAKRAARLARRYGFKVCGGDAE